MSNEMTEEQRELKNSMLRAAAAAANAQSGAVQPSPSVPMMPTPNNLNAPQQQAALEFDLPVESPRIPSQGLLYPEGSPLHGVSTVDIKAITPTEENILMNPVLIKRGTVISELIRSCLMDKRIDVGDMVSGDRNALMVAIRAVGYGREYTPEVTCPGCESKQDFEVDLVSLSLKELDLSKLDQVAPFKNEFRLSLPASKKTVTFKFLTGREEEKLLSDIDARKKKGLGSDNLITQRLLMMITSVEGITDRSIIAKFVANMPGRDSVLLRKHYDENEPAIDMSQEFVCKSCGHTEVLTVPLGPTFLWPNART